MNRLPQIGDVIKTNCSGTYVVKLVRTCSVEHYGRDGLVSFVVVPYNPENNPHYSKDDCYLNGYELVDGGLIRGAQSAPGTTGYSSNGGGKNGDGYDYIDIIQTAAQGSLF